MPGLNEFDHLTKTYGLTVGLLIACCAVLIYAVILLYRDNQALHAKLTELLDERGKFLDSILNEAINGKGNHQSS